jgi:hypothetical protein
MTKRLELDIMVLMKDYEISLSANDAPIKLSGFPKDFLINVTLGAASSLKGVNEIETLELTLRFGKVKMAVNGNPIPLVPFPTLIIGRTLIAIVSTLKGVEGNVTSLEIKMGKKVQQAL